MTAILTVKLDISGAEGPRSPPPGVPASLPSSAQTCSEGASGSTGL